MLSTGQIDKLRMVLASSQPVLWALSDPVRQDILLELSGNSRLSVGELTARTSLSRPAVSHHIRILREAGLLKEERRATKRYYYPDLSRTVPILGDLASEFSDCTVGGVGK